MRKATADKAGVAECIIVISSRVRFTDFKTELQPLMNRKGHESSITPLMTVITAIGTRGRMQLQER